MMLIYQRKKGEETRRRRPQDVPMLSPRFPPDVIEMIIERLNGLSEKWVAGQRNIMIKN